MSLWDGLWLVDISFSQHNDLAGLQGGQAGEYYHLTNSEYGQLPTYDAHILDGSIHFTEASLNLPTTYLKLDCSNDPLTGQLDTQDIFPSSSGVYDFGDNNNFYRTLYLDNQGGNVIFCKPIQQSGDPATNYIAILGGGQFGSDLNQGGTFTFKMNDIASSLGTSVNQIIFDPGRPDVFASGTTNDVIFQAYNGIATYGFVSSFGGFNDLEYGLELRRISGTETFAKTLIFDNQIPVSDFRRSIDFRINTVNKLTIENDGTITVTDRITTPELTATVINNGVQFGTVAVPGVNFIAFGNFFGLNWFDYLTINAVTSNLPVCLGLFPNGIATASYMNVYNSSNTGATAWLSMGTRGSIAELVVRDFSQTTNITNLNIGSGGNDFPVFDVTCTTLTDINFVFAGLTELTIQPDTLVFNNGAVDTQIDWTTSGEMGLQVAASDIIRLSATLVSITQNTNIAGNLTLTRDNDRIYLGAGQDWDFYYDGTYAYMRTDLKNPSDLRVDCGTNKTLELQEIVWEDLRIIPGAFEFAGVSDPSLQNWQPGGAGTTFKVWKFQSGDEVFFTCQIPHSYKQGTDIEVHVHWTPADRGNEESGNTVAWKLDYSWTNVNAVFPSSATADMTDTCTGTDDYHEITASITVTGTGKNISSMLVCRLYRDAGDTWAGITAAQSPALLEFDIHFQINTMGSRQEFVK